ncbi:GNAT family N-acetyltransferase [Herbaspirillum autotrophicum]|uniref:GNAT family N-acetyltransferase n=1 Tax=Herbaspirillum autotrophicum TaxID=180195 RepID=UPI000B0683BA|nr:GNAT family N-acetyltransferase [Herbaspirillum autotrophicum]
MSDRQLHISPANDADLDDIIALQAANQIARGGALAAEMPRDRVATMMRDMPLIVARRDQRVSGFLMTATRQTNIDIPIVQAMFAAYAGSAAAYVYGPVCVAQEERGQGLAQLMCAELRRLQPGREGILFIRRDNQPSMRAHARMGMQEVAGFHFNGFDYAVLSFIG